MTTFGLENCSIEPSIPSNCLSFIFVRRREGHVGVAGYVSSSLLGTETAVGDDGSRKKKIRTEFGNKKRKGKIQISPSKIKFFQLSPQSKIYLTIASI